MGEPMDERYATFREHAELRERTATLEETVRQVGPSLARIETLIVSKAPVPAEHVNWQATAMRAMDMLERKQSGGMGHSILITLALIGVGVTAFVIGKVFF